MKRKILIVDDPSCFGGGQCMLQHYIAHLKEHEVYLVRNIEGPEDKSVWGDVSTHFIKFPTYPKDMSKWLVRFKVFWPVVICSLRIGKIVFTKKPDIIIANAFYSLIPLYFVKFLFRFKLIFIVHTSDTPHSGGAQKLLNVCDAFIGCCHYVLNSFKLYDKKTTVVYNAVHKKERLLKNKSTYQVLFLGRLIKDKNPMNLILAIEKLRNEQKIKLSILGDGPMITELDKYVKKNNLENHVKLLGFQDDVGAFLEESDLLCLPSEHEGFPIVLLEALAYGVPVLASNVGGISELVQDGINGHFLDSNSVEAIIQGIQKCQITSQLSWQKKIYSSNVNKFTLENQKEELLSFLNKF